MNFSAGFSEHRIAALSWIYVSSLSLSLTGSFSVAVVSIIKHRRLNEQAAPLLQLVLADFLASMVLLGSTILNLIPGDVILYSEDLCNRILPLSLAFYCVSFLHVIVYACESVHMLRTWRERAERNMFTEQVSCRRRFYAWSALAWLLPISGYFIYANTFSLTEASLVPAQHVLTHTAAVRFCTSCFLFLHIQHDSCSTVDSKHTQFINGFTFTSVLIVLISCTVLYCKLQSSYSQIQSRSVLVMRQRRPGVWTSARYMIIVLIFCWTPALILICVSFAQLEINTLFPLYVTQAVSVSLQGFLNSVVYGWRRQNFRDAVLGERLPLTDYSRAFYEQSLTVPS